MNQSNQAAPLRIAVMKRQTTIALVATLGLLAWLGQFAAVRAQDEALDQLLESTIKAAARKVAPSVVMIETSGGTDIVTSGTRGGPGGLMLRKGIGPTSGLVASADGYIISSAFNFVNKPTAITISVPGQKERYVAKMVATDQTRMLTLLKIDARGLPVPAPSPKKEFRIGQTSIALGRTLAGSVDLPPSVSVGILSALNRIWGKAIQTDAKISPTNYGGPLVDLEGRVQAVLVPASPQDEGEAAGVVWYDSGIGFGIPLEDVNAVLPRLKQGKDLKKGLLGVNMKGTDQYAIAPVIDSVAPGSAAEKAGIKAGDTIIAIDDKPVASQAQLRHQLGLRYEGDAVTVKVKRDDKEKVFPGVVLSSQVAAYRQAFLGILPLRDDAPPGVEIRYVYPKSPAEAAGLKEGDRILKIGQGSDPLRPIGGRDQLLTLFETAVPGMEIKIEVKRKAGDKTETVTAKLIEAPESVPERLPEVSSAKKAKPAQPAAKKEDEKKEAKKDEEKKEDDEKKDETGLLKRTTAAADHGYYVYVPNNYDPNVAHALVLWLHPTNKNKEKDIDNLTFFWSSYCEDNHVIMLCPISDNANGWTPSEGEFISEAVKAVLGAYTIDSKRVVVHGMGVGGQMAFYLGFQSRALVRGVATTGAALTSNPKEKLGNQPLAFFLVAGGKDPLKEAIQDSKSKLSDFKYAVIYKEIANMGHEYLNLETLDELVRWIDSLDRI